MMSKLRVIAGMALAGALVSGVAGAGVLETNLSGQFSKGRNAQIEITGFGNAGFNFRLSAGNITPGQRCVNGPEDCMTLWGWATRTNDPNVFLYANENGQCVFTFRNEKESLKVSGLKGHCGTTSIDRGALKSVEGVYRPSN